MHVQCEIYVLLVIKNGIACQNNVELEAAALENGVATFFIPFWRRDNKTINNKAILNFMAI